jgi:DnaD/phage-associated family protein
MDVTRVVVQESHKPSINHNILTIIPEAAKPNIFILYESSIGMIPQGLVDELKDAEATYPSDWVTEAFKIALDNNVRKWSYIRAILKRWETEGRNNHKQTQEAVPGEEF